MLARSGRLPGGSQWRFEVKWDGFRAIVCTRGALRVRSRSGWDMTARVPELEGLPSGLLLDGEIVAWGEDGLPSFPFLERRILRGVLLDDRALIAVTYLIFDLLAIDREDTMQMPYARRRRLLEEQRLSGPAWHTPPSFEDGAALWGVACELELEGVIAKRANERYRPGERGWVKVKNRDYWRYPLERAAARHRRQAASMFAIR
jgi:bifunctional non-homologous end joining protein LigD